MAARRGRAPGAARTSMRSALHVAAALAVGRRESLRVSTEAASAVTAAGVAVGSRGSAPAWHILQASAAAAAAMANSSWEWLRARATTTTVASALATTTTTTTNHARARCRCCCGRACGASSWWGSCRRRCSACRAWGRPLRSPRAAWQSFPRRRQWRQLAAAGSERQSPRLGRLEPRVVPTWLSARAVGELRSVAGAVWMRGVAVVWMRGVTVVWMQAQLEHSRPARLWGLRQTWWTCVAGPLPARLRLAAVAAPAGRPRRQRMRRSATAPSVGPPPRHPGQLACLRLCRGLVRSRPRPHMPGAGAARMAAAAGAAGPRVSVARVRMRAVGDAVRQTVRQRQAAEDGGKARLLACRPQAAMRKRIQRTTSAWPPGPAAAAAAASGAGAGP
mmetsp:Transcript_30606/g.90768  ORF Transcript_30606/g.90768 Transcript_30606/m.90768 type:complete len:391 (+) Transcript_30606:916-2088(+)